MVIIVLGLPGSGKSYFAQRLANKLNAKYVNSDRVRKQLFSKRTYAECEKKVVYEIMLKNMQTALIQKKTIVLDATFHIRAIRKQFIQEAKNNILFIEVNADEQITKYRLKQNRPYSEADYGIYKLIKNAWEPVEVAHLVLKSTNDNIDDMLKQAMSYIKDDKRRNR